MPVANGNSTPANPIANLRSFGEDPEQVTNLPTAFLDGASDAGALTTAKQFPGHGDTAVENHLALPDLARLYRE